MPQDLNFRCRIRSSPTTGTGVRHSPCVRKSSLNGLRHHGPPVVVRQSATGTGDHDMPRSPTSSDPRRRVVKPGDLTPELRERLRQARYGGSAHHKRRPADYGFNPAPRPKKNVCDPKGFPPVKLKEAIGLFRSGIRRGMVSHKLNDKGLPVFVWAVDGNKQVYEAKPGEDGRTYHGYRLYRDDRQYRPLLHEWKTREGTSDG